MVKILVIFTYKIKYVRIHNMFHNAMGERYMFKKFAVGVLLLVASSVALADENSGLYLGVQGGVADSHYSNSDYTLLRNTVDSTKFAGRVYGGYAFSEFLALEAGYDYLGRPNLNDRITGSKQDFLQQGVDVVGKATLPLDYGFGFYVKAGGIWVHRGPVNSQGGLFIQRDSSSKISLLGGAGVSYAFGQPVAIDLSWTKSMSNNSLPKMDLYMVGLIYKFAM